MWGQEIATAIRSLQSDQEIADSKLDFSKRRSMIVKLSQVLRNMWKEIQADVFDVGFVIYAVRLGIRVHSHLVAPRETLSVLIHAHEI